MDSIIVSHGNSEAKENEVSIRKVLPGNPKKGQLR